MPQCKMAYCREQAVPGGKRYCPAHMASYKAKQAEYRRIQNLLPDCAHHDTCGNKVKVIKHANGDIVPAADLCQSCINENEEELQRQVDYDRVAGARAVMFRELDAMESYDDIKDFIRKYLLP